MGSSRVGFVASIAVLGAFGGCIGSSEPDSLPVEPPVLPDVSLVATLPAADVAVVGDAIKVTWKGPLDAPKGLRVTIPDGITRVDAAYSLATPTTTGSIALYAFPSGRIRCQPDIYEAWFTVHDGTVQCSGVTVLDPLPATWRAPLLALASGTSLELILSASPLDGGAALLHLDQLTMPHLDELPTETLKVPASSDGEPLHVEVTRPDTPDRVPTIVVSSPYNHATRNAGRRPENGTIADWVPRGYAVVTTDVRGFGESGGCVEVWGPKEQQDQVDIVEWVAAQEWSSGKVGFYGQSYVGTTPVAAASLAAPHLTTIITVAPVINAYEDWHYGGVPNGENTGSPAAYQQLGTSAVVDPMDPLTTALNVGNGLCDPTLAVRANDPDAVYDAFYRERDFKTMVKDVEAAVLYTQGFLDQNVKGQMIPGWFNELDVPKKGIFGDWVHQHPPRADQELLFHAWFDHWLLGLDTGIMETPVAEVRTNVDTLRSATEWPPSDATPRSFGLDFGGMVLADGTDGGGASRYVANPASGTLGTNAAVNGVAPSLLRLETKVTERIYVAGNAELVFTANLQNMQNTHFYARLLDTDGDDVRVVTYGALNAAHNADHTSFAPVTPGQERAYRLPFLPTEYVLQPGHTLALELRSTDTAYATGASPTAPGVVNLQGVGSALLLPTLETPGDVPLPKSAGPVTLVS